MDAGRMASTSSNFPPFAEARLAAVNFFSIIRDAGCGPHEIPGVELSQSVRIHRGFFLIHSRRIEQNSHSPYSRRPYLRLHTHHRPPDPKLPLIVIEVISHEIPVETVELPPEIPLN